MDNWKKRWEKFMFTEDMVVGGNTVLNPKPETYSDFVRMLDDIGKFISQELDKAREEGELRILEGATVQAKGLRIRSVYRNGYKYTLDIKKEKVSKLNKEE